MLKQYLHRNTKTIKEERLRACTKNLIEKLGGRKTNKQKQNPKKPSTQRK